MGTLSMNPFARPLGDRAARRVPQVAVRRFRVLQLNMQFGQIWDPQAPDEAPVDLSRCIAAIKECDADVIILQEVESVGPRGQRSEPPRNYLTLCEALRPMHGVFGYPPFSERELPFGIGLAMFSREPWKDSFERILPPADIRFNFEGRETSPTARLLIGATTTVGGIELRVLNTHLQAYFMIGATSEQHPEQRSVVEDVLRSSHLPTIIGGDFNLGPGENLVQQFGRIGFRTSQDSAVTWKRRPYVTDHVFFGPSFRCLDSRVMPTDASDHDRLVVDLEVHR